MSKKFFCSLAPKGEAPRNPDRTKFMHVHDYYTVLRHQLDTLREKFSESLDERIDELKKMADAEEARMTDDPVRAHLSLTRQDVFSKCYCNVMLKEEGEQVHSETTDHGGASAETAPRVIGTPATFNFYSELIDTTPHGVRLLYGASADDDAEKASLFDLILQKLFGSALSSLSLESSSVSCGQVEKKKGEPLFSYEPQLAIKVAKRSNLMAIPFARIVDVVDVVERLLPQMWLGGKIGLAVWLTGNYAWHAPVSPADVYGNDLELLCSLSARKWTARQVIRARISIDYVYHADPNSETENIKTANVKVKTIVSKTKISKNCQKLSKHFSY